MEEVRRSFAAFAVRTGLAVCFGLAAGFSAVATEAPPGPGGDAPGALRVSEEGAPLAPDTVWFERPRPAARAFDAPGFLGSERIDLAFATANQDPEGDMPRQVAFLPDGSAAVIANRDTDTVTFFDVATRTITDTVPTGDFPVDVAVSPDGRVVVVPNVFANTVTVIDVAARAPLGDVAITGDQPYRVAITSDSAFAVVGVINDAVISSVSVIDLASLTEVRSFPTVSQGVFGFFFTPEPGISGNIFTQFALSPDDTTLVLPDRTTAVVALYDVTTGAELVRIPVATLPTSVDVSADGTVAVIGHEGSSNTVSTIDLVTQSLGASLSIGQSLVNQIIRITPDRAFALAAISNNVIFVDLATGAITATIGTGTVGDIEISFDGQFAFVSNFNARILDIATQTLVRTIPFAPCVEAAVSPTELRAVALNNRFREDVHLYDISGGGGFFEGKALSGEPEEGDATRTVAVTPDGATAVSVNNTSDNAAIHDLNTGSVRAYVPTGERSLGVAVSPDGETAVVANFNSDTVSILDLTTDATVATLGVSQGPTEVAITPDGELAIVTTVAGTDRIHFIRLAGAASTVLGSVISGQMGSIGYTFGVFSGIAVSPDGSLVAACISFDDELLLVRTADRGVQARIPVGDFPIRAAFSPAGDKVYVSHSFSDDLRVIDVASGTVEATVPGIEFPLSVVPDALGDFVYVGSFDFQTPRIAVVDTQTNTIVRNVPLSSRPRGMALAHPDAVLHVIATDGELVTLHAAGAQSAVIDSRPLSGGPSDLAFSAAAHVGVVAQPIPDGIDRFSLAPEIDCRRGNLNLTSGSTADVVLVNGTAGSPLDRRVSLTPADPFTLSLLGPPSNESGPARFACYIWVGTPSPDSVRTLPFDLGVSCMVMPPSSDPERPMDDSKKIANNIGRFGILGVPNLPSTPAPVDLVTRPNGVGREITVFVQGLMLDSAAPEGRAGVTNGVEIGFQ